MLRTYTASCHCGAVTLAVDLDLSRGASRCNCRFCRKTRNWSARTAPDALTVTQGDDRIARYDRLGQGLVVHAFCRDCGIRLFSQGTLPELGGAFVSVSLPALDDVSPEDLIAAPLTWCDGLNDNWWNPPAEIRHL